MNPMVPPCTATIRALNGLPPNFLQRPAHSIPSMLKTAQISFASRRVWQVLTNRPLRRLLRPQLGQLAWRWSTCPKSHLDAFTDHLPHGSRAGLPRGWQSLVLSHRQTWKYLGGRFASSLVLSPITMLGRSESSQS